VKTRRSFNRTLAKLIGAIEIGNSWLRVACGFLVSCAAADPSFSCGKPDGKMRAT
jgi:hypothetical protein